MQSFCQQAASLTFLERCADRVLERSPGDAPAYAPLLAERPGADALAFDAPHAQSMVRSPPKLVGPLRRSGSRDAGLSPGSQVVVRGVTSLSHGPKVNGKLAVVVSRNGVGTTYIIKVEDGTYYQIKQSHLACTEELVRPLRRSARSRACPPSLQGPRRHAFARVSEAHTALAARRAQQQRDEVSRPASKVEGPACAVEAPLHGPPALLGAALAQQGETPLMTTKEAAQARIRTLSACEAPNHPNPLYLAPSTTHSISPRHREKVVKWINEVPHVPSLSSLIPLTHEYFSPAPARRGLWLLRADGGHGMQLL